MLFDESHASAPHHCMQFADTHQIFVAVSRLAWSSQNENISHEALKLFGVLIDGEEGVDFLSNGGFANAFTTLIGSVTNSGALRLGVNMEGEALELLFGVAAQIRLQPDILPAWFTPSTQESQEGSEHRTGESSKVKPGKDEFPLFYMLLDHVYHEGRVGDFARTGLLYIIESATRSERLEKWIVESDLATLMASGLGALYSQLSR